MTTGTGTDADGTAVRVVLDQPAHRAALRLRGRLGSAIGGGLVAVGAAANAAAFVYTIVWVLHGETRDRDVQVHNLAVLASVWVVAIGLGWLGRRGMRLLRGRRRLVLFLRRFGHEPATDAVSAACARIGRRWRLVTLDDAAIAPVRLNPALARPARAVYRVRERAKRLAHRLTKVGIIALFIVIPALALIFAVVPDQDVRTLRFPPDSAVGFLLWPFVGAFLLLWAATGVALAVALVLIPFRPLNPLLDAAVRADGSAVGHVRTAADIDVAAQMVSEQSRQVLSPKLTVLTVHTAIWRDTVRRLAAASSAYLIDVSRPTEHVLWEIEEMTRAGQGDCIFVGHLDRLRRFTGDTRVEVLAVGPGSLQGRLERLLADREVLAYTTDPNGLDRFARALHTRLEAGPGRRPRP
ncbi:MAG: hypothetical protein ACM3JP_01005 [Betaproteobacteria bacterium]